MIYKGRFIFTEEPVRITVRDTRIAAVEPLVDSYDLPYISPGFIDMQVNGYKGNDYSLEGFSPQHLRHILHELASSGVTQHLPTLISAPQPRMLKTLGVIAGQRAAHRDVAHAIPGIHLEGPCISGEDGPRGVHDPTVLRDPDIAEFEEWQEAADGHISMITLAPERRGALKFIEYISEAGVIAAIGHSAAEPELIREAVAAGAQFSTHLGNGSHAQLPRLHNYLWEQLAADELRAGIISDGFHLPASVVKTLSRAKGLERLVLVSDAALLGGLRPGIHTWGNLDVQVYEDGHLGLAGTKFLAGAGHLLDWDIVQFMRFTGHNLSESIRLCTVNPAALLKFSPGKEALKVGAPADLTIFRTQPGARALHILKTISHGIEVYNHASELSEENACE
ncbi:N-acetylglucosamine-6-phosphate deacetylase [candidate division KSB3 bacterium]|uniref:N-acetylglucosamine-6-phosphate deacetylase n=1 Tax=candidate division KSB3 bacterium TaxID=2044937 RepID=A0A2G6E6N9_9BACT|nr:MAG: N-acetylglucosamine-6-phosphate deacetylase [candidate division KSB3 bacterium]PIE30126.1 MAG: N-acetylglucosamine-6-phosphate deacetylase [candidate division KSB3 bacterium]